MSAYAVELLGILIAFGLLIFLAFRGFTLLLAVLAAVLVAAASWAKKHPDMPVLVASYADPYGSEKANADFARLRAQVVVDGLVATGVMASRIQRREVGSVKFQSDPQESRRVEIIVGNP